MSGEYRIYTAHQRESEVIGILIITPGERPWWFQSDRNDLDDWPYERLRHVIEAVIVMITSGPAWIGEARSPQEALAKFRLSVAYSA